ncbi:MAG: type transport system ATP-binding protein [Thermoanaerobaculia bacterium]|jgi:ABC-2 type transport system ATP-binding protein|nr:type transport system ATP-binding protein [Thermoanaerobaculia bacterium]
MVRWMTNPTLTASNLTKTIGDKTIVDSVSFELQQGEIFGFLGPNGAGKTTTIRMLVGLIRPTAGSVRICGYDIDRNFEDAMRCVGCIVENPDLYRFMTGRENLEHFARMLRVPGSEIERVAKAVSLDHRLEQRVGTYSLGMRQRLGIAQALLGDPKLLILDEPANGLDPAGIREIRELLKRLAAEQQMSIFISSHLLAEIELTCDRVAIIHKGRILREGTVRELISNRRDMELRVDDVARASAVAHERNLTFRAEGDRLWLAMEETDTPPLIAALVESGVNVFHAQRRTQSLEEMFLEATGGETVD